MTTDPATLHATQPVKSMPGMRRSVRYRVNALCNETQAAARQSYEEAWSLAEIIDIALHGVALNIQQHFVPGTILFLAPSIPSWNPECVLSARVVDATLVGDRTWRTGCEFLKPLDKNQLHVFLQNSQ